MNRHRTQWILFGCATGLTCSLFLVNHGWYFLLILLVVVSLLACGVALEPYEPPDLDAPRTRARFGVDRIQTGPWSGSDDLRSADEERMKHG